MQVGIRPEEGTRAVLNGTVTTSIPLTINNMGFYDISNLEITTYITDKNGTAISNSTAPTYSIPKNSKVTKTHNISISLNNTSCLLTNDTVLNVDMLVALTYANAIPLKISLNTNMSWGAPLYNLTVGEISIVPPNQVNVSLSFENHAFFSLDGTIRLEIVDRLNNKIGSRTTYITVPHESPRNRYDDVIPVTITGDPEDVAEVHLHFDMSVFSYGPVVIAVD